MVIGWDANRFEQPDYQVTATTGPVVSGMGFVTYITATTPDLAGGTYEVLWTMVGLCTQAGAAFGVQVLLGGTPVPTATETSHTSSANADRIVVTASGNYTHTGGMLTVLMQVRREVGSGNVTPQAGNISMRRVR